MNYLNESPHCTDVFIDPRALRTRARWKKIRAATLVFILFRRRVNHGVGRQHKPAKRMATTMLFSKQSSQAATAIAATLLATKPAASSAQLPPSAAKKLDLFERLTRKPMQNRSDADIKLLAEFIRHTKFFQGLTSASIDALAMQLRFRTFHEGELLYHQGSSIDDASCRYVVITGSLFAYRNSHFVQFAREGEDYVKWYLASNPSATAESVKFGECVDICSTGDTCGDDAIAGHLFREQSVIAQEKTVVAFVTQADYKRVIRFNVENEPQLLEHVKELLTPPKLTKQELRQAKPHESSQPPVTNEVRYSPQQLRMLHRFLGRYACFRILPFQFCVELIRKLHLKTVKSDGIVCKAADTKPSMFMMLEGKLCVHIHDTHEGHRLAHLEEQRRHHQFVHSPRQQKNAPPNDAIPLCEPGPIAVATIGEGTLHLCNLCGATLFHSVPAIGQPQSAVLVQLSRQDYESVLCRYLETVDFNLAAVRSILAKSLPQDRTDEQLFYIKSYMMRKSAAKLFFSQIPSSILDQLLLQSRVEVHHVDEHSDDFIHKEGTSVECMRVIVHGYVGLFKGAGASTALNSGISAAADASSSDAEFAPKKAVLRRYQSRLVRANTRVLDTSNIRASGRRASITRPVLPQPTLENRSLEPLSILPPGAAFGHLQILTGQDRSPYSYAAFASASASIVEVEGAELSSHVVLLAVPTRFVSLILPQIDEQTVYNPVRVLKRVQHSCLTSQRAEEPTASFLRTLRIAQMLSHSPALHGVPRSVASQMIENMAIIGVEPRHIIYERGDVLRETLYVVLSGTVRVFQYASKPRNRRGSAHAGDDKRPKLPRRGSQEIDADPSTEELAQNAANGPKYAFEKPAGDAIFMSDYSKTMELGPGDWFGRHGVIASRQNHGRRPSTSTSPRRSTHSVPVPTVYMESVVSMSDCVIGVVTRQYQGQCELSAQEREVLIRFAKERDDAADIESGGFSSPVGRLSFESLAGSFRVLESMGLANRLSTTQRVQVASTIKYWKLAPGETVYREGEASHAIFFVLSGNITIQAKVAADAEKESKSQATTETDIPLLDLMEGEVFGEEAFMDSHGSQRRVTAIASSDGPLGTELLYVTRDDYDRIIDERISILMLTARQQATSKKGNVLRLLDLGQRSVTAKDRWKIAVYQVLQRRAQRSQWPTLLTKARDRRIELLMDLVKQLPVFEDSPAATVRQFCTNGILQTFAQDTILFTKGDPMVDVWFLVVHGAITLYQTHHSAAMTSSVMVGAGLLTGNTGMQMDSSAIRVPIQTIRTGEICGEFESLEDHTRRHISAVVAEPGTKLVIFQQEDFYLLWPQREQLERKLSLLKTQIRTACRLDPDQVCALYYAMRERSFRRNDVLSGNKEQAGCLHLVVDGTCIVHDAVVLKQKKRDLATPSSLCPTHLSLDTRVSTLGTGAILFTARPDQAKTSDSLYRRASSRVLESPAEEPAVQAASESKPSQYVVADSPTVRTLCVQLFPRRTSLAQHRVQELYIEFLLGKNGLHVIRQTVALQNEWRATKVVQAGRLAVSSLSQANDSICTTVPVSDMATGSPRRTQVSLKANASHDLTRVLASRQCEHTVKEAIDSPRHPDALLPPSMTSPRSHGPDTKHRGPTTACSRPVAIQGSFSPRSPSLSSSTSQAPRPSLPSLSSPSIGLSPLPFSSTDRAIDLKESTPSKWSAAEQLRVEERVLGSVAKPPPRDELARSQQQQQMRRRHGRPPPKHVENNGKFIDEHSFSAVVGLRDEHERKKSGLCRRLLHVKPTGV